MAAASSDKPLDSRVANQHPYQETKNVEPSGPVPTTNAPGQAEVELKHPTCGGADAQRDMAAAKDTKDSTDGSGARPSLDGKGSHDSSGSDGHPRRVSMDPVAISDALAHVAADGAIKVRRPCCWFDRSLGHCWFDRSLGHCWFDRSLGHCCWFDRSLVCHRGLCLFNDHHRHCVCVSIYLSIYLSSTRRAALDMTCRRKSVMPVWLASLWSVEVMD